MWRHLEIRAAGGRDPRSDACGSPRWTRTGSGPARPLNRALEPLRPARAPVELRIRPGGPARHAPVRAGRPICSDRSLRVLAAGGGWGGSSRLNRRGLSEVGGLASRDIVWTYAAFCHEKPERGRIAPHGSKDSNRRVIRSAALRLSQYSVVLTGASPVTARNSGVDRERIDAIQCQISTAFDPALSEHPVPTPWAAVRERPVRRGGIRRGKRGHPVPRRSRLCARRQEGLLCASAVGA